MAAQVKKRVTIESPKSSTVSLTNPPSTPSTPPSSRIRSSSSPKKNVVIVVSTPSSRRVNRSSKKALSEMQLNISPSRSPLKSALSQGSPSKSSSIPRMPDARSMLKMKAQRNPVIALENSVRKANEHELEARFSQSRSALGKPQRLFTIGSPKKDSTLPCMSDSTPSSIRVTPGKRGVVVLSSVNNRRSPSKPQVSTEMELGLKSPARRIAPKTPVRHKSPNNAGVSASGSPNMKRKLSVKNPAEALRQLRASSPAKRGKKDGSLCVDDDTPDTITTAKKLSKLDAPELKPPGFHLSQSTMMTKIPTKLAHEVSRQKIVAARSPVKVNIRMGSSQSKIPSLEPDANKMAPLNDVVVFIDVRTSEGDDASAAYGVIMKKMGARVVKQISSKTTHVVFLNGSPKTPHTAKNMKVPCVSISWIVECDKHKRKVGESGHEVEVGTEPRYMTTRRQKSLEPKIMTPVKTVRTPVTTPPETTPVKKSTTPVKENTTPIEKSTTPVEKGTTLVEKSTTAEGIPDPAIVQAHIERIRRRSVSHAPIVASPLTKRSWSIHEVDDDQE
ncbi:hypothetical protein V1512DRAFT_220448 [Lipomyces arxii]|uniref:uncharacterized protein n=1 Tax=Lipomyces arxii TaxID=56418 RepID=UPI0034CE169F